MANSQEISVNLKINRIPDQATLEDMIANDQIEPNQLYMLPSELGSGVVAIQSKILWTNSNPSTTFNAQTISNLTLSEYSYIMIHLKNYISSVSALAQLFRYENEGQGFLTSNFVTSNIEYRRTRRFTLGPTSIIFDPAYQMTSSATTPATGNDTLIPIKIIGIKLIESSTQITNKYSTNETIIGEWIDGKKLYRKVIEVTSPSSANTNTNVQEITDLNIETFVDIKATYYSSTSKSWRNIQYITADSDYMNAWVYINNNQYYIRMRTGTNSTNIKVYVTLEYTKTTD